MWLLTSQTCEINMLIKKNTAALPQSLISNDNKSSSSKHNLIRTWSNNKEKKTKTKEIENQNSK